MDKKITLLSFTKGIRIWILVVILCIFSQVYLEILMPQYAKYIINYVTNNNLSNNQKESEILKNSLILFSLIVGTIILSLLGEIFIANKISSIFAKNLKISLFKKIQSFSFSDIDKFSSGTLLNRLDTDVAYIKGAFDTVLTSFIRLPIMFGLAMFYSINESIQLSLIFVVALPFLITVPGFFFVWSKKYLKELLLTSDKYNNKLQENLNALKTIKSHLTETKESTSINKINLELKTNSIKFEKINYFNNMFFMTIVFGSVISLAVIGVNKVLHKEFNVGTITAFGTYIWMVSGSLSGLVFSLISFTYSIPSMKRIKNEILNYTSDISSNNDVESKEILGKLELQNVSLKYPNNTKESLKNLNLEIQPYSTIGIIGETGSGKSSLINLFVRFYEATSGNVVIDGVNIKDYNLSSLRDQILNFQ
ncbi:ABC transporter transmembrane domain-containing protein [Mycoplasma leonicaptivi]|uniref:ABC transporter transmembrane domain-containing protein n=1 Tax=Mycoplasma leonicaptivi TaxID=36742 RepID=UPI0004819C73|nr:ABC transporter ATP-binding protein [Mycoplasma leonicaptivi]